MKAKVQTKGKTKKVTGPAGKASSASAKSKPAKGKTIAKPTPVAGKSAASKVAAKAVKAKAKAAPPPKKAASASVKPEAKSKLNKNAAAKPIAGAKITSKTGGTTSAKNSKTTTKKAVAPAQKNPAANKAVKPTLSPTKGKNIAELSKKATGQKKAAEAKKAMPLKNSKEIKKAPDQKKVTNKSNTASTKEVKKVNKASAKVKSEATKKDSPKKGTPKSTKATAPKSAQPAKKPDAQVVKSDEAASKAAKPEKPKKAAKVKEERVAAPTSKKKEKEKPAHDGDADMPTEIPDDLPLDIIELKPKRGKGKPKAPSGPKLVMKVFTTAKSAMPEAFVEPPKNYKKTKYIKFELEYMIHSSKHILFNYLSTEAGLKEWFADEVKEVGDIFTFFWDGSSQMARLISMKEDHHVRFRWVDMYEPVFFEFRIEVDELTGDLALIITDFAEDDVAVDSAKLLWKSQIEALFHVLGAHS